MHQRAGVPVFIETQGFRQPWLWILVMSTELVFAAVMVYFVGEAMGDWVDGDGGAGLPYLGYILGGILAILMSGLTLAFLYALKMITEVRADGIYVRLFPLSRQERIAFGEIRSCEVRRYAAVQEYGGWGLRSGPSGRACSVSGDQGVQLTLDTGPPLLIGSQRAADLAAAIRLYLN